MKKEDVIKKLETIIDKTGNDGTRRFEIKVRVWENYGKSRTYFKVIQTRDCSKMYIEYDFGFIDNETGEYNAGRRNVTENYNLSGASF